MSRKPRIKVSGPDGKHPFMRGMLTHSLLRKGLTFAEASSVANGVRERLTEDGEASGQDVEIEAPELGKLVLRVVRDDIIELGEALELRHEFTGHGGIDRIK